MANIRASLTVRACLVWQTRGQHWPSCPATAAGCAVEWAVSPAALSGSPTGVKSRSRRVPVRGFDADADRWVDVGPATGVDRDELTLSTYNIWYDPKCAEIRFGHIIDLLSRDAPDVMVFQEVIPRALDIFLEQPWIRDGYVAAAVVGGDVGNYGMLLLSRLPVGRITYVRLPTQANRGFLRADLLLNGGTTVVCSVHLDSGKRSSWLRHWQLRAVFRALRDAESAVVLGDFNMRANEDHRIVAPFRDIWPALRPDEPGYTEDTSINHMRYDMKNKPRHVRFDRVLVKGSSWAPQGIELLGTEAVSKKLPRVFPSDHFGLYCRMTRSEVRGSGRFSGLADALRPRPRATRAR
jgi:endonuclease/exonuclease/phosphatase family metal-dependent hydrolase